MKKGFEDSSVVVAALFAICLASAAIPQGLQAQATILTACYVPDVGVVYRIKETGLPDACRQDTHVEFSWNMEGAAGPQGATGAQGATGPAGPQGPQGEASLLNLTRVSTANTIQGQAGFSTETATADCPAGTIVLAGSVTFDEGLEFIGDRPTADRLGWEALFIVDANPFGVTVWAICF